MTGPPCGIMNGPGGRRYPTGTQSPGGTMGNRPAASGGMQRGAMPGLPDGDTTTPHNMQIFVK